MPPDSDELRERLQSALGAGYAVGDRIGAGGFAVVYRVTDLALKRALAVKVMSPEVFASRTAVRRFQREAEIIAQLSHPNIVPLHFIGQQEDLAYLVMPMVGGGSLADRLRREPQLPVAEATKIFAEVASALGFAHSRGIAHRDVKPHNILLDTDANRALVTDFGIARLASSENLTETGVVMGTPAYLSPEQVTGEATDHRADVFALGVVAYEMLAGVTPYEGATPTESLMKRVATRAKPVIKLRSDVPATVSDLIDRCLESRPETRLSDAAEIPRVLSGEIALAPSRTVAIRAATRRKFVAGGVAVIVIGASIAALVLNNSSGGTAASPAEPVNPGMALIAAGPYPIGNNSGSENALAPRVAQLAAFGIERTEVSIREYAEFVATGRAVATYAAGADPMVPVSGVTMPEAAAYCAWKHPEVGRLPTEEEWEAAARGAPGRNFPWGDLWNRSAVNVAGRAPQPVGSHPLGRTPEGVDDMIGNVWEWTSSPFAAGRTDLYVIRGAAFNSYVTVATPSYRAGIPPTLDRPDLSATGFRCAMTARGARAP